MAYREYFGTDRLMFNVPKVDDRLPNKAEVLALRNSGPPEEQLAIAADFLAQRPVYHDRIGREAFVVLTDKQRRQPRLRSRQSSTLRPGMAMPPRRIAKGAHGESARTS